MNQHVSDINVASTGSVLQDLSRHLASGLKPCKY